MEAHREQQPSREDNGSHRQADPESSWIQEIFKQQREAMQQQQQAFLNQQEKLVTELFAVLKAKEPTDTARTIESLANNIKEFQFDREDRVTFTGWYSRYEDLFEKDTEGLDDAARVRLLLRKLGLAEHEKYASHVLPAKPNEFDFKTTVEKLKKLFGSPTSKIEKCFRCLNLQKLPDEDFVMYSCRVNRAVIESTMNGMSEEELKCLVFVCGLKEESHAETRIRLLSCLEERRVLTLAQMTDECKRLVSLKRDTAMIAKSEKSIAVVRDVNYKSKFSRPQEKKVKCWLCGGGHFAQNCPKKSHKCQRCHVIGHKEGFCASAQRWRNKRKQSIKTVLVNTVYSGRRGHVNVILDHTPVSMMVDTGAEISIISKDVWCNMGRPTLWPTGINARSASGNLVQILGEFQCAVTIGRHQQQCLIRVASCNLLLLGTDIMDKFGLWDVPLSSICNQINVVQDAVASLKTSFPTLFAPKLGCCVKAQISLVLKEGVSAIFRPKRPVAYAMLQAVEGELHRLESEGIITPVEYSEWAAPIVVVRKANGTIRICGDYSTGLNEALMSHQYPLPLPEEIFANLSTCSIFSQLDLSDAFLQVEVAEQSRELLTVNTHRGLYRYNRLPPGVKAAPGAFQQLIDTMLAGLEGVAAYMDDIVIGGNTMDAHDRNLRAVLQRLQEYGFTIRPSKCSFYQSQIRYLGHILDEKGLRPDPDKIMAITKLQPPTDVSGVRSFLGAINFYGKFVRNMRMLRQPLDDLLKEGTAFQWTQKCQHAFEQFKKILSSDLLLTHYNPKLEIIVSADASSFGVGATIAHKFPDGTLKVVQHASRALTAAEQRYSQPDREGLAIIYAVTKFHRMIFGRHFRLQTDHQPLLRIFGSKKGIPVYTANRLQRFALTLLLYDFDIEYVPTEKFGNADVLSRLIDRHEKPEEDFIIASMELENDMEALVKNAATFLPLSFNDVVRETRKDPVLRLVHDYVQNGWPAKVEGQELGRFFVRRESLSTAENCIIFGERLVIPASQRHKVLQMMHIGHPGIERMKGIARSYVYWPQIDADIERMVKTCKSCLSVAKSPAHSTPVQWPTTSVPWQRIHIDYAGPIEGLYFLLAIDSYSKWPEIVPTTRISSAATVEILRGLCSRLGMPSCIVSDNGRQFTSSEFADFCNSNGIEHIRTAPYHPQSNGQAERFVDTFKRALKKIKEGKRTLQEALDVFLLTYRSTPHKLLEEHKSPAELMFGRRIRTCLELLRIPPKLKPVCDQTHPKRRYNIGDLVYAKEYKQNTWKWIAGEIEQRVGKVMYKILKSTGGKQVSHINQLRPRLADSSKLLEQNRDSQQPSMALDILLEAWDLNESKTALPCTCDTNQPVIVPGRESSSSSPATSSSSSSSPSSPSLSSSPCLLTSSFSSSVLSHSRPPEECPETPRSANSPGFATADSRSPSPVRTLRRSSRVRRPPLWMDQYRQN